MERTAADFRRFGEWARSTDPQTFRRMAEDVGSRSAEKVGRYMAEVDWEQAERYWEDEAAEIERAREEWRNQEADTCPVCGQDWDRCDGR